MNSYLSKGQENKSKSFADNTSQNRSVQEVTLHSSENIQLIQLNELANDSLQSSEITQLQEIADNFSTQDQTYQLSQNRAIFQRQEEVNEKPQLNSFSSTLQREVGDQERENDNTSFFESWSKEEKAFIWVEGEKKFKRKDPEVTSDKLPEELENSEKIEVPNTSETNFSFGADSVVSISDIKLSTIDQVDPQQINKLNPKGETIRTFLHEQCKQSWHIATKELNKDSVTEDSSKKDNRRNMLRKIWEYRQWHHNFILNKTQKALGGDKLTEWAAAGSTTLTSDIDVNLKGTDTEAAVQKFNELFVADGWNYEAGIVYDVNVYALDFMHKEATFGSGMVTKETDFNLDEGLTNVTKDLHGNVLKKKSAVTGETVTDNTTKKTGISSKEGARKGRAQGGFDGSNQSIIEEDRKDQDIWTHVKTRLYMSKSEWDSHAEAINLDDKTKLKIEKRFEDYSETLLNRMLDNSPSEVVEVEDGNAVLAVEVLKSFSKRAIANGEEMDEDELEAESSNLMMASSNRIYEEKLLLINSLRQSLKSQVTKYDSILNNNTIPLSDSLQKELDLINFDIESNLQLLRNMLAEAALFSNEAYITDGAVNHAVVGTQVGMAVKLTNSESKNAVVENLADSLKEISRHGDTIGEAAFKSGKYLFRMTDAALNMGYKEEDIRNIYNVANKISNEIKGDSSLSSEEQKVKSETAIKSISGWNGLNTADDLKEKVKKLAQAIIIWYNNKDSVFDSQDSNAVGTNKPKKE